MARSSRIYVVSNLSGDPYAGFTVKHELVSWLKRRRMDAPLCPPVRIYSMRDNPRTKADVFNLKLLLEKELLDDQ